jgi:DNA anti-recombination protein RmuC
MSAECARLAVDLERLLPKVDADDLDEDRRIAFAEAALAKIAALEAAADGDAAVLAQVATYEEAMLGVIDGLRPREEELEAPAPAPAEALGLRRRAVPAQRDESDSESDPEEEPPQNEADSLQRELETMTARLKASSLAVHEKLREQSKAMERLDDATSQNQNAVSKERTALDKRAAARTRTLLQALAALVAVVGSFLGTYVFIAVFPKHR